MGRDTVLAGPGGADHPSGNGAGNGEAALGKSEKARLERLFCNLLPSHSGTSD